MVKIDTATHKSGLTLLELLIGIAIIGMIMGGILPLLRQQEPGYERKQFVARLNEVMQFTWQQAVITHKVHRVLFNFPQRTASVERIITKDTTEKKVKFEPVKGIGSSMSWPKGIEIQQFIVEGYDELRRLAQKAATSWFYVIPDGMTQQVTINGVDKIDKIDEKPTPFGLVLNPYMAQFKAYDEFQK